MKSQIIFLAFIYCVLSISTKSKNSGVKDLSEIHLYDNTYPFSDTVSNIGYITYGYNYFYGNPRSTEGEVDSGFRSIPIFEHKYKEKINGDTRKWIPEHTFIREERGCSIDDSSKEIASTKDYSSELSVDFNLDVPGIPGVTSFGFSASHQYKTIQQSTSSSNSVFVEKSARCSIYKVSIDFADPPLFTKSFRDAFKELYNSDFEKNDKNNEEENKKNNEKSLKKFYDFFELFGTNYMKTITMGSKFGIISEISSSEYNSMKQSSHTNSVNFDFGLVKGSSQFSLSQKSENGQKTQMSNTKQYSIGAPMPTDMNMNTWAQNAATEPMPQSYSSGFIYELAAPPFKSGFLYGNDITPDKEPASDPETLKKIKDFQDKFIKAMEKYVKSLKDEGEILEMSKPVFAENSCVKLYQNENKVGTPFLVCENMPELLGFENLARSIEVPLNFENEIYIFSEPHYGGSKTKIVNSENNLARLGVYDDVSSIIVFPQKCIEVERANFFKNDNRILCDKSKNAKEYEVKKIRKFTLFDSKKGRTKVFLYDDKDYKDSSENTKKLSENIPDIDQISQITIPKEFDISLYLFEEPNYQKFLAKVSESVSKLPFKSLIFSPQNCFFVKTQDPEGSEPTEPKIFCDDTKRFMDSEGNLFLKIVSIGEYKLRVYQNSEFNGPYVDILNSIEWKDFFILGSVKLIKQIDSNEIRLISSLDSSNELALKDNVYNLENELSLDTIEIPKLNNKIESVILFTEGSFRGKQSEEKIPETLGNHYIQINNNLGVKSIILNKNRCIEIKKKLWCSESSNMKKDYQEDDITLPKSLSDGKLGFFYTKNFFTGIMLPLGLNLPDTENLKTIEEVKSFKIFDGNCILLMGKNPKVNNVDNQVIEVCENMKSIGEMSDKLTYIYFPDKLREKNPDLKVFLFSEFNYQGKNQIEMKNSGDLKIGQALLSLRSIIVETENCVNVEIYSSEDLNSALAKGPICRSVSNILAYFNLNKRKETSFTVKFSAVEKPNHNLKILTYGGAFYQKPIDYAILNDNIHNVVSFKLILIDKDCAQVYTKTKNILNVCENMKSVYEFENSQIEKIVESEYIKGLKFFSENNYLVPTDQTKPFKSIVSDASKCLPVVVSLDIEKNGYMCENQFSTMELYKQNILEKTDVQISSENTIMRFKDPFFTDIVTDDNFDSFNYIVSFQIISKAKFAHIKFDEYKKKKCLKIINKRWAIDIFRKDQEYSACFTNKAIRGNADETVKFEKTDKIVFEDVLTDSYDLELFENRNYIGKSEHIDKSYEDDLIYFKSFILSRKFTLFSNTFNKDTKYYVIENTPKLPDNFIAMSWEISQSKFSNYIYFFSEANYKGKILKWDWETNVQNIETVTSVVNKPEKPGLDKIGSMIVDVDKCIYFKYDQSKLIFACENDIIPNLNDAKGKYITVALLSQQDKNIEFYAPIKKKDKEELVEFDSNSLPPLDNAQYPTASVEKDKLKKYTKFRLVNPKKKFNYNFIENTCPKIKYNCGIFFCTTQTVCHNQDNLGRPLFEGYQIENIKPALITINKIKLRYVKEVKENNVVKEKYIENEDLKKEKTVSNLKIIYKPETRCVLLGNDDYFTKGLIGKPMKQICKNYLSFNNEEDFNSAAFNDINPYALVFKEPYFRSEPVRFTETGKSEEIISKGIISLIIDPKYCIRLSAGTQIQYFCDKENDIFVHKYYFKNDNVKVESLDVKNDANIIITLYSEPFLQGQTKILNFNENYDWNFRSFIIENKIKKNRRFALVSKEMQIMVKRELRKRKMRNMRFFVICKYF